MGKMNMNQAPLTYGGDIQALVDSEELYRATFDNAAVGIAHVKLDGTFRNVNTKFCNIVGYSYEELIRLTFQEITHPDDLEADLAQLVKLNAGEISTYSMEKRYFHRDGSIVWINLTASSVTDEKGAPKYYIAVIEDISERRRAEQQVRESSRLLDQIFRHSLGCLVLTDWNFNFVRVNQTYADVCARKVEDFPGRNHFEMYPSDFEKVWQEVRETKIPWQISGRPFVFPDHPEWGVTYWNISLVPVTNEKGEGELFLFSLNDVTELKRAEEKLEKVNHVLEERVEERTRELRQAQQSLMEKERLAVLGRLTATVSHELRNPLSTINSSVFVLRQMLQELSPKMEITMERLERNIARCDKIINELLDFTRKQDLALSVVDVNSWLENMLDELQPPPGVSVEKKFAEPGLLANMDSGRMQRTIINVFENACHAVSEFSRQGEEGRIVISTARNGPNVEIAVQDSGPGIANDLQEKIFEPLFSTRNFGVGLGLAVVKGIMEEHEGGVRVESGKDMGAKFVLWLPLASIQQ
ncbi:MAG: PAS domain S-box protein [Deltaproteobacteria bacterium]|nr:PAS domain S-box protein [Deltaproteobacteria bacterium]